MPEMFKLSVVILGILQFQPFKVVSNIPYGITSDIFKILFESLGNFPGSIVLQFRTIQKLFLEEVYNPYNVFYHILSFLI